MEKLLLLLLLCSAFSASTEEKDIELLVLAPYPKPELDSFFQPSIADGPALHLAAELAAEIANASSSILQGYQLKLRPGDSGCSIPFRAMEAITFPLVSSTQDDSGEKRLPPIVGVVGPACSLSAIHVSSLTARSEIALINIHLTGTNKLNNRDLYPYSFSILDSAELIARTMVSLIQLAKWSNIAIFYDASREYFSSVARQFNEKLPTEQIMNYTLVPLFSTNLDPFHGIKDAYRVVFLLVDVELLSKLMCTALFYEYSHPTYQFILVVEDAESIGPADIEYRSTLQSCTRNQTRMMLNGSISILFQLERPDNNSVTSSGITLSEFKEMYKEKVEESNQVDAELQIEETIYAVNFFDAVWAFILALNSSANTIDLSEYRFGQQNVTDLIREELLWLDFEGLSGRIQFNRTTGRIQQNATIFMVHEEGMSKAASYFRESDSIVNLTQEELVFIDDRFDEIILTVPKALAGLMLVVAFLGLLITLFLNVMICRNRTSQSVKASSVKLIQLAFIGCYIQVLSLVFVVIVYGFSDVIDGESICIVQHFLDFSLSVGLTILFGAISVRIWRLYRIFVHFKNPGKLLSDYFLAAIVGVIVGIDLVFTVPSIFVSAYQLDLQAVSNGGLPVVTKVVGCKRDNFFLWFFLGLLVASVLLTVIFALGILTRKIPMKNFKTKSMIYMSYALTAVIPFTLSIYVIFVSLKETGYVYLVLKFCTLCVLFLSLIIIPSLMLFIPPLLPILKLKLLQVTATVHMVID